MSRVTHHSSSTRGAAGGHAGEPATLLDWLEHERTRLNALLPPLERAATDATEALAEADVIRRHVILHPERFTAREREGVSDRAQAAAEDRQRSAAAAQAVRDQVRLCDAIIASLREGMALTGPAAGSNAAQPAPDTVKPPTATVRALEIFQAVESERLAIARDLHDGPAQVLADLVLKAEILDRIAARNPEQLTAELEEFKAMVRNAVADIRRFMFDLRPDSLDDLGLAATMRRYASEYQDRTGINCRFNVAGEERRLGPEVEEGIFRIIQEALNNAQHHAGPKTIEVTLTTGTEEAVIRVRDDGSGFDPEAPPPADGRRRLGLIGMRERAEAMGGNLEIKSKPGRGTDITARIPLAAS